MHRSLTLLALASASLLHAADTPVWPAPYKHVLILTIDGFREADLEDAHLAADLPNLRALQAAGITYTNATSPMPADSFPGLLGIVTGANPKTTGVYYDDTYSRELYGPATSVNGSLPVTLVGGVPTAGGVPATLGAEVAWTEAVSKNSAFLNGIAKNLNPVPPLATTGYDATALDPAKLPQQLIGGALVPYYPHQFLKVNTIFEVAHAAGLRTAWADKHPSYEILNGPSGVGMDDFFGPESEAKITATPPSNRITGTFLLLDAGSNKASKSQGGSIGQDDMRVQAVLNQLQGRTSKGAAVAGDVVPALFGMNFIAVNSAQKFNTGVNFQPDNSLTTGSQLNGGIDTDGTVSANLHEAYAHTDASIGKLIAAMKAGTDSDGRSIFANTLIVVTAKHGNTPRLGKAVVMPSDWFSTVYGAPPAPPTIYSANMTYVGGVAPLAGITVARGLIDAVTMLWLANQADVPTAVSNLQAFAAANPSLIDTIAAGAQIPLLNPGLGNPATDNRAPDIIVNLKPGVIVATSLKRGEHGGFTPEETLVPLVLSGGIPSAVQGTTQLGAVSTTQVAVTALKALGLDTGALQGAKSEGTAILPGSINHAPVAVADTLKAQKDGKLVVPSSILSANDTDVDGDPLLVTAVSATTSAGGTVSLVDGKVIYTPPAGFTGNDTFTYTVRDGARVSDRIPSAEQLGWADVGHTVSLYRSGYGSSLAAVPGVAGEYYLLADRGPNGDTSGVPAGAAALTDPNAKIFAKADYHPEIAHVRWNADGSVTVLGTIVLKDEADVPLTGLPNHLNAATWPSTTPIIDVGYDTAGTALAPDPKGIDSEGLVALADGTFWISDEYGPYLLHVDASGRTLERIDPFTVNAQGHKLPAVLARRLTNKGMEGLTVTPDGSLLVGMMQSALVNDPVNDPIGNPFVTGGANTYGKNSKKNLMLRVVTYRLVAGTEPVGTVHQYPYLLGDPAAAAALVITQAISELTAVSNTDFLVDERDGKFASDVGGSTKKTWRFTLTGATPIDDAGDAVDGLKVMVGGTTATTLETLVYNQKGYDAKTALAAYGIVPLAKDAAPTVDLSVVGLAYTHDKIEGVLAANGRVLYSNDDDFGLNGAAAKIITGSYPVGNLAASAVAGQTKDYGQLLEIDPSKLQSDIGIVTVAVSVAGNTPPTISDTTDKTTAVNTASTGIPVTISDVETMAANLGFSATSSNTALVAASGIVLGGSGANRTVTLSPVSLQVGTTTITVTVTDGQGVTASDTFVLTVSNSAPVAAAGGASVAAGATVNGTVTAVDADGPSALVYTLVTPPTKGTVTITGATGAFAYTANAGVTGSDTFTFKANDGLSDSNVATETVTFTAGSTPPGTTSGSSSNSCGLGSGLAAMISLAVTALLALRLGRRAPELGDQS